MLIIVGAVLVVGLLGVYMVFGRGGGAVPGVPGTGGDQPFSGTLKAAVAMGVPMKCTYTVEGAEYEGYIKGEQYMGKVKVGDKMGSVIVKDNCMWSWEEGATQGVKLCFEPEEGSEETIWDSSDTAELNMSYTCRPAAVTDSQFEPPNDVQFMDLDSMMNGTMSPEEMEDYLKQFETGE
jgi:hypothetical protein